MPLDVLGGLVAFADFLSWMRALFGRRERFEKGDRERVLKAVIFVFSADDQVSDKEIAHLHDNDTWMPEGSRTELEQQIDAMVAELKDLDDAGRAEYAVKLAKEMSSDETVRRETLVATAMAAASDLDGLLKQRAAHDHLARLMEADVDEIDLEARVHLHLEED
jgi:hypothetical protein